MKVLSWRRAVLLMLLASVAAANTYVRGDGNGYYAWLASAVVDHDLDFRNQYQHADPLFRSAHIDPAGQPQPNETTPTGRVGDQWAVGPAVLWAPWFLAAHVVVKITGADPQDGFAPLYRHAVAAGSMVYAFLAVTLSLFASRRFGMSVRATRFAAVLMWGASALLMYSYILPFHVHSSAAFTVALFLWYWTTRTAVMTRSEWAVWGACYGLMGMTYHVDLVLGIVALHAARLAWPVRRWKLVGDATAFTAAAILVAAPQWIGKAIVYGSPLETGYRDQFFWTSPRLLAVLFSTNHGAILWTPIIAFGLAGLVLLRKDERVRWMLAGAAIFYFTIACYQNWHGLSSFGNRFFIALTLPIQIGVAAMVHRVSRRGRFASVAVAAIGAFLIAWNAGLAFQWAAKMIPNRGGVNVNLVIGQQRQLPALIAQYGYLYFTDRARLIRDIEERDRDEASRHFNSR